MAGAVVILEDCPGRLAELRACLAELLPRHDHVFFDNAAEMIAWLKDHLAEVVFISLDHDLPLRQFRDGRRVDAGTGRDVCDFLAGLPPTCPVVVHSSNDFFAPGMVGALCDAGWPNWRVYPFEDHAWVRKSWAERVRHLIRDGWIEPG